MLARLLRRVADAGRAAPRAVQRRLVAATTPGTPAVLVGAVADLLRRKRALVAENALPRQQLVVLRPRAAGPAGEPRPHLAFAW